MQNIIVSLIQLTSTPDLQENLAKIREWIRKERRTWKEKKHPHLFCLPENFSYFGEERKKWESLKEISHFTLEFLSTTSREEGIYLLGGGYPFPAENPEKYYNQASLFDPDGREILRYRKIHLFDTQPGDGVAYRESDFTQPGQNLPGIATLGENCKFTTFICYDLRFPEIFRKLSAQGVEIICLPAAFTIPTGKAHWEVLLRARAIENFCFVLAPAQVGIHTYKSGQKPARQTYGHSMVVDPWGRVLGELDGEKEGILSLVLEPEVLWESRKKIPALEHRRYD